MIAYIQDNNIEFWEKRVNTWINDCIVKITDIEWSEQDKLVNNSALSDYSSIHKRISKENITIFHYWIALN